MRTVKFVVKWGLAGALAASLTGLGATATAELAPGERSTPETIGFEAVTEEQLEQTSIEGAFDPPGVVLDMGPVEPVDLSATFLRARGMDPEEEKQRRDFLNDPALMGDRRTGASAPVPVIQRGGFENRTYSPSSTLNTTHHPRR